MIFDPNNARRGLVRAAQEQARQDRLKFEAWMAARGPVRRSERPSRANGGNGSFIHPLDAAELRDWPTTEDNDD